MRTYVYVCVCVSVCPQSTKYRTRHWETMEKAGKELTRTYTRRRPVRASGFKGPSAWAGLIGGAILSVIAPPAGAIVLGGTALAALAGGSEPIGERYVVEQTYREHMTYKQQVRVRRMQACLTRMPAASTCLACCIRQYLYDNLQQVSMQISMIRISTVPCVCVCVHMPCCM